MKNSSTKAIILKRLDFGEADRILTVITPEHGKLSILAKGARRSKSKLAGGLELFSVSTIGFIDGKSDLKTVVSTQLDTHYGKIVQNMEITMMAYEFLRLIGVFTQESCDGGYFSLLEAGLDALNEHDEQPEIVYVWFLAQLLEHAGSGINVECQINGQVFDENHRYQFSLDDMGFTVHPSGQFGPKHIKFLRLLGKVSKPSNLIHIAGSLTLAKDIRPVLETSAVMAQR